MNRLDRRPILITALVCLAGAVLAVPLPTDDVPVNAVMFAVAWALCLALLAREGLWRPSVAYLVLFGLFHGGLLLSVAVRGADAFTAFDVSWLYGGYTTEATRLVILGMTAFTLCAELTAGRAGPPTITTPTTGDAGPVDLPRRCGVIGLAVEFAGLAVFTAAVARAGGFYQLTGSYPAFVQANQSDALLGYGTLLIGMGATLAIVADRPTRIAAWLGFAAYAAVAFQVGTRGEVLFPLLALLVVEARRGRHIRPLWTILAVPCVLGLIGLVRTTRLPDGSSAASTLWSAPFDAVAEMGYSLRPTTVVLDWHAFDEPFRHGVTLIVVPVRFVEKLTGWHGGPPVRDDRLFNVEILDRVGPIGGSPVAEGYHNAGLLGVLLLLGTIGCAIGWLERRPATPLGHAAVGVLLLPLLGQIRNSFAPVPAQIAVGLLLLLMVHEVAQRAESRRTQRVGPS
ncbi:MAG TPA: O-antigen polysaccharide polymerase Wzy [Actinophytocola sp.]|nr:O-antigen polysaccharide polymerase Wzy [Actinophytocola sp.]